MERILKDWRYGRNASGVLFRVRFFGPTLPMLRMYSRRARGYHA